MNEPARNEEVERQIADYERRLREQLYREHELAALAAEQRALARTKRFLPVLGGPGGPDLASAGSDGFLPRGADGSQYGQNARL